MGSLRTKVGVAVAGTTPALAGVALAGPPPTANEDGTRTRQLTHRAYAGAVAFAAALALTACGGDDTRDQSRQVMLDTITLTAPPSWSVEYLPVECGRYGPGVIVANVEPRFDRYAAGLRLGSCTTAWDLRRVARTAVIVELLRFQAPQLWSTQVPPPLTAQPYVSGRTREPLCSCSFRFGNFAVGEADYGVRVWVGDDATDGDRRRADEIVASLRATP